MDSALEIYFDRLRKSRGEEGGKKKEFVLICDTARVVHKRRPTRSSAGATTSCATSGSSRSVLQRTQSDNLSNRNRLKRVFFASSATSPTKTATSFEAHCRWTPQEGSPPGRTDVRVGLPLVTRKLSPCINDLRKQLTKEVGLDDLPESPPRRWSSWPVEEEDQQRHIVMQFERRGQQSSAESGRPERPVKEGANRCIAIQHAPKRVVRKPSAEPGQPERPVKEGANRCIAIQHAPAKIVVRKPSLELGQPERLISESEPVISPMLESPKAKFYSARKRAQRGRRYSPDITSPKKRVGDYPISNESKSLSPFSRAWWDHVDNVIHDVESTEERTERYFRQKVLGHSYPSDGNLLKLNKAVSTGIFDLSRYGGEKSTRTTSVVDKPFA